MKNTIIIILASSLYSFGFGFGGVVFDPTHNANTVANQVKDALVYADQLEAQWSQVTQQLETVRNLDKQLNELGDFSEILDIKGIDDLKGILNKGSAVMGADSTMDAIEAVTGEGYLQRHFGRYGSLTGTFSIPTTANGANNGTDTARNVSIYEGMEAVTTSVDNYRATKEEVASRKVILNQAKAEAVTALQTATTQAEVQKQEAIIGAIDSEIAEQNDQLQESAEDVEMAEKEVSMKEEAETKASAEYSKKFWELGTKDSKGAYKGTKPNLSW